MGKVTSQTDGLGTTTTTTTTADTTTTTTSGHGDSGDGVALHDRQTMILVPINTAGVRLIRPLSVFGFDDAPRMYYTTTATTTTSTTTSGIVRLVID